MSDPRSTEPYRRLRPRVVATRADARTNGVSTGGIRTSGFRPGITETSTAGSAWAPSTWAPWNWTPSTWTILWTWVATVAAAAVVLGVVFGFSRGGLVHDQSAEPATTGSAPHGPAAGPPASNGARTPRAGGAG